MVTGLSRGRALSVGLIAYALSRLAVLVGLGVRASQLAVDTNKLGAPIPQTPEVGSTWRMVTEMLTTWDGLWYLAVARNGYPRSIPAEVTYHMEEARAAFFPLYPLLIRVADAILPGGDTAAALGVNLLIGALAVVMVGLLTHRLTHDTTHAAMAMVLFSVFPGSFVLSFAYADGLMIVLAAGTLIALGDRRWVLAGVLAALTTATRPNGIAILAAVAVAAFCALRRPRDLGALWSVALAPLGLIGFHAFLALHTDERLAWFRVQGEAWDEGLSFGGTALRHIGGTLTAPLSSPTQMITTITVITTLAALMALRAYRLPAPVLAYVAVILVLMIIPDTVTARPRFLFTAFALVIPVAVWLPRRSPLAWQMLLWACGVGLVGLSALYAAHGAIP